MDLEAQIERFQDYYEVDEVIDGNGNDEDAGNVEVLKTLRVSLPYSRPDWTGTDVLLCIIRLHKDMLVSIEVVSGPDYLNDAVATTFRSPHKLSTRAILLDSVDSFYVHLHDRHPNTANTSTTTSVSVRDFCYPPYDPRHFGLYPPLHPHSVWTEHTVQQPYQGQECKLAVGDRLLVRRPDIIIQDGMLVCKRADDHLPNNIYSLPNWILKPL